MTIWQDSRTLAAVAALALAACAPGADARAVRDSASAEGATATRASTLTATPVAELAAVMRGLPARLSLGTTNGSMWFDLIGDLTVRGVTRPTAWRVTASQSGDRLTGTASTKLTFAEFGISPPRVPIVLSVADTIGLEYDFTLTRDRGE